MKRMMLFAAVAATLVSCGGGGGRPQFGDDEYPVTTVGTSSADMQSTYPATIKGVQDVEIRPKASGFITQINVKEGQTVGAGQVLFVIDNETAQQQVRQAQAAVNTAQQQCNTAKLTYENSQKLHESRVIGDFELQTSQNSYEVAQAQLAQAKASLASAKEQLSYCYVKSPAAGVVGTLPFKKGALVSSSNVLTTVSNNSSMEVYFSVTEKAAMQLQAAGLQSLPSVKLQLADGSIYGHEGKVTKMSGVIDQATGSVQLIALFQNPERVLKSGGAGTIVIPRQATDAIIAVLATLTPQYEMLMTLLTANQVNLLKAIAKEGKVEQPQSNEFIKRNDLPSPSSVKAALDVLVDKELVYTQPDGYIIYDRLLNLWLQRGMTA